MIADSRSEELVENPGCVMCGRVLVRGGRGRPAKFCTAGCRIAAQHEVRRIDAQLAALERERSVLRQEPMGSFRDLHGRDAAKRLVALTDEITRVEERMRSLL
jgi:hypothetical protein